MKKVWILERFETREMMEKCISGYQDMIKHVETSDKAPKDEAIKEIERVIEHMKKEIEENPEGRWQGIEGKTIYRIFCNVAKDAIRRQPNMKFRVVEGELEDDAKYWPGYKFIRENEGVMRYLYATA